jgi:hypothetical protein
MLETRNPCRFLVEKLRGKWVVGYLKARFQCGHIETRKKNNAKTNVHRIRRTQHTLKRKSSIMTPHSRRQEESYK